MPLSLETLIASAQQAIASAADSKTLEQVRIDYLGKQGQITLLMKNLAQLSEAERPLYGQRVNEAKTLIVTALTLKLNAFEQAVLNQKLTQECIDITLPGRDRACGSLHPVTLVKRRVSDIFTRLGFSVEEGMEIEDDDHNFEKLNMPSHHPARQSQDTFFTECLRNDKPLLLRTHTSSVQIRAMERNLKKNGHATPMRMIAMGRVYRRDSDHTHTPMFHQLEGLVINKNCSFADLKGMLYQFIAAFFEKEIPLRFRPSYFPFTEPSAEVDIEHTLCHGKGCRVCGNTGWLEVLGCGMVHPNVLHNVGIDSNEYNGFAFGVGLDRLAMLLYGIDDLRILFDNDLRFLEQFV